MYDQWKSDWKRENKARLKEKVRLEIEGRERLKKEKQRKHDWEISLLKEKVRQEIEERERLVKE